MRKYKILSKSFHNFPIGSIVECKELVDHRPQNWTLYACYGKIPAIHPTQIFTQSVSGYQLQAVCNRLSKDTTIL